MSAAWPAARTPCAGLAGYSSHHSKLRPRGRQTAAPYDTDADDERLDRLRRSERLHLPCDVILRPCR
jgi:hypothetical protein